MRHRLARDTSTTTFEHGTTLLVSAIGFGTVAVAVCVRIAGLQLGIAPAPAASWVLVAVVFLAAALRFWSMASLGPLFTRTLRVTEDHHLVQSGPYRFLRHPGYLGNLLAIAPAATVIAESWLFGAALGVVLGSAYAYRIHHEERMLLATLGERYRAYQQRTHRLIPWVY